MKTDPHILEQREYCIKIANLIPLVLVNKRSVTDADRERYNTDLPELIKVINKSPLWDGHLTMVKRFIDNAMLKATQINNKPAVPRANAYYGREVAKMPRKILEAQPPQKTDKVSERLPDGHRNKKCPRCHKFVYQFDKYKNRIRPTNEINLECPTCIKYRDMMQKERNAMQKKSDEKAAKRKAKANKGKPDPKYVKAMEKRKKELREKERAEGAPSREERRKSRGF